MNTNAKGRSTLSGNITISKNSSGTVRVSFRDKASRNVFATADLSPADFAEALFGLSRVECELEVSGLENVGKTKISEPRQIATPLNTYDKNELRAWLQENAQEPGWILDGYLGSQGSIGRSEDGRIVLRYRVFKYVEA